jgi:hypothetical protein
MLKYLAMQERRLARMVRLFNSGTIRAVRETTLTQAASGSRPTFNTALLNGLPGIVFNRSSDTWLAQQAITLGGTTASVFAVVKTATTGPLLIDTPLL